MELILHPVGDYIALLEQWSLLASPIGGTLDVTTPVTLVSYDSRQVVPDTLFFCKGAHFKVDFLAQAVANGAQAYMSEVVYPEIAIPCIHVTDMRQAMAPLADFYYGSPSKSLDVIGITGTKGKTTTTYYLTEIFNRYLASENRGQSGYLSSVNSYDGVSVYKSKLTTPEPIELQQNFHHCQTNNLPYLTMEVSSQALKYHRTLSTQFAVACFLNIGLDHISPIEHPDFEDYFQSKLKIFAQTDTACVNLDSKEAERVLQAAQSCNTVITFSQKNASASVYGSNVHKNGHTTVFRVRTPRYADEFALAMPGLFNVENALAAIAICEGLDIPQWAVKQGLGCARAPGRMEMYTSQDGKITAIVDYAHNRMSFETLFASVRGEFPSHAIVSVFGCTGQKGLDRRQAMGEIAGRYSKQIILTEDDPGNEDVRAICEEIALAVTAEGCPYQIYINRGEAIRQGVLACTEPTILLVAGKGPESEQKREGGAVMTPTDGEYVRAFLQEYDVKHQA